MSRLLVNDYFKQLDLIKKMNGSSRETIARDARVTTVSMKLSASRGR